MAELQVIPARHGVATFVPAGQTIKIVNTSGTQVIDTWAFALPKPGPKQGGDDKEQEEKKSDEAKTPAMTTPKKSKTSKKDVDLPSQADAEKTTQGMLKQGEPAGDDAKGATPQKSTWSSYVPSLGLSSSTKKNETEQQKDSRTWASYFPSGKGFSSYIPKSASDTVSAFAKDVRVAFIASERTSTLTSSSTNETPTNHTFNSCKTSPKRQLARQVRNI